MSIRTTVTLDEDVHRRTKEFSRKRGIPFREALNELVRTGLQMERPTPPRTEFRIKPRHIGVKVNVDKTGEVLEWLEGPLHR